MIYPQLFIGIDVSKLKHDVAIFNEQKKPVHKLLVIGENLKGYQALISKLEQLQQRYQTQKFLIGLEATSDYWKNLYTFLKKQSQAYALTLLNPVQTKNFAEAELRRAKTDPVNAKDIANATSGELRQVRYGKKQWALPKNFITRMKTLAQDSIAYKTGAAVLASLCKHSSSGLSSINWQPMHSRTK